MSALSIIKPKEPNARGWFRVPERVQALDVLGYPYERYVHEETGMFVISALEVARDPGAPDLGPEYHLSVTRGGERCTSAEASWTLAQFDLLDAKEDNHVPGGKARNFWRPVADHLSGYECACKDDEPAVIEDKGDYVWRGITR